MYRAKGDSRMFFGPNRACISASWASTSCIGISTGRDSPG